MSGVMRRVLLVIVLMLANSAHAVNFNEYDVYIGAGASLSIYDAPEDNDINLVESSDWSNGYGRQFFFGRYFNQYSPFDRIQPAIEFSNVNTGDMTQTLCEKTNSGSSCFEAEKKNFDNFLISGLIKFVVTPEVKSMVRLGMDIGAEGAAWGVGAEYKIVGNFVFRGEWGRWGDVSLTQASLFYHFQ